MNARELTAEIDRATDLAVAAGAEEMAMQPGAGMGQPNFGTEQTDARIMELARERAKQMGWQVLDGGKATGDAGQVPEMAGAQAFDMGAMCSPEVYGAAFEAAEELKRDENELVNSTEYVGVETQLQVDERLAREQENLKNENDPTRDFEARIASKSQEKIAHETMLEVNKIVNHKQFAPMDLVRLQRKMGNMVLNSYEDPHPIGRGNG